MKKLYSVTNFSQGINEYSPQGASDIKNFNITNSGVLETRRGWSVNNSFNLSELSDTGTPMQVFFANQKLLMQTNNGLYYGVGNTWAAVSNQTDESGPTYTGYFAARLKVVVADNNRVFLASTNANLWLDTSGTPTLYKWGIDPPDIDDFSFSSAGSGLVESGEYAYAFAYEGLFGAASPLSARKTYTQAATGPVTIGLPTNVGLDAQITKLVIYRTEKETEVTFPDGQTYERVLAENAPLKQIGTVDKGSMGTGSGTHSDNAGAIGLAPLAGQLEGAGKPPNYLTNITLYGGRIWGSIGSTDQVAFSALDETAAPLYDVFPGEAAPIPHIINVRDQVTGIGASRDYLAVFSNNSIQLVRGQGVIAGIYGKQQPGTDLDLSQYLTLMGAKDDWCVAESLGNVYFYSPHDQRVYRIDRDGNVAWISQAIQELLSGSESPTFLGGDPTAGIIKQVVAHEGSIYVVRRASGDVTLFQFDELRDQWTSHSFGSSANMTSFTSNPRQKAGEHAIGLYALRDVDSQVVKVFPHSGAGSTSDNLAAIVPSYTSQEFAFAKPPRLDSVRIGTESEQDASVTVSMEIDGVTQTPLTGKTLSKSNNFTIRTFQRGYKHKVGFTLSGAQTVRFFELQFRSR